MITIRLSIPSFNDLMRIYGLTEKDEMVSMITTIITGNLVFLFFSTSGPRLRLNVT